MGSDALRLANRETMRYSLALQTMKPDLVFTCQLIRIVLPCNVPKCGMICGRRSKHGVLTSGISKHVELMTWGLQAGVTIPRQNMQLGPLQP